jgi:hypothetical protein
MPGHPVDALVDLVEGRLTVDDERAVRGHIASCASCSDELAWIERFRSSARGGGLAHLSPTTLVAIDAGATPSPEDATHLAGCSMCRSELALLGELPSEATPAEAREADDAPAEARAASKIRRIRFPRRPSLQWASAGLAAAALALAFQLFRGGDRVSDLAIVEPLRLQIPRSAATDPSFARALDLYRAAAYGRVATELEALSHEHTESADVLLVRGSAELLAGSPARAIVFLEQAARLSPSAELRSESLWQLANAHLLAGHGDAALRVLTDLEQTGGSKAPQAKALAAKVSSHGR